MYKRFFFVSILMFGFIGVAGEPNPTEEQVTISLNGKLYSLAWLKDHLEVHPIHVPQIADYDNQSKDYLAFSMDQVMALIGEIHPETQRLLITCLDGYQPKLELKHFSEGKAFLAFQEVAPVEPKAKDGLWTAVKMGAEWVSPGPFYLVWESEPESCNNCWPYQIKSMDVVLKNELAIFSALKPTVDDAQVQIGYRAFTENCAVCHGLQLKGPYKAPDLTFVMNYRSHDDIERIIQMGGTQMPPFSEKLSKEERTGILRYITHIRDRFIKAREAHPSE